MNRYLFRGPVVVVSTPHGKRWRIPMQGGGRVRRRISFVATAPGGKNPRVVAELDAAAEDIGTYIELRDSRELRNSGK